MILRSVANLLIKRGIRKTKRNSKEYQKQYYREHREKIPADSKRFNAIPFGKAKRKVYDIENKEKKREYDRQRYLRRKEAGELGKPKKAI